MCGFVVVYFIKKYMYGSVLLCLDNFRTVSLVVISVKLQSSGK